MEIKEVTEMMETTDRWEQVWSVALQREFPPPETFDHLDMNDKSQEAIDSWVDAPWLC